MFKNDPSHYNERVQIERLKDGDEQALEEVLSVYEKPIYTHLVRLIGNTDDAGDLLQETFIRFYNWRVHIDPNGNIKNLLYKIATNIAYDHFRKQKRSNLISIDDEDYSETIDAALTYTNVERDIIAIDLENALQKLRPHYNNILLLYYREGFSYEDIAQMLNIPINTIKTHLRRARQELASLLQETYG